MICDPLRVFQRDQRDQQNPFSKFRLLKMIHKLNQAFYVVIERDEDGIYVGEVPQLRACYSQGETIDELMENIKEAIELCLEEQSEEPITEFVGIQKVML
jgi:predicted RNase H-like HicB family nuclease